MACVAARPPPPSLTAAVSRLSATARSGVGARARDDGSVAGVDGRDGEPVLELGVEAALRLPGLEVEEADDERAREAEERGREGQAHALERAGERVLQLVEEHGRVLSGPQRRDDAPDAIRRSR